MELSETALMEESDETCEVKQTLTVKLILLTPQ